MIETYNLCPICGCSGQEIFGLPQYPVTEIYQVFNENKFSFPTSFDLAFNYCEDCQHGYLGTLLSKSFIYENYNTHSASSIGSINAINNFYDFIISNSSFHQQVIIDIGANDTLLLKKFEHTNAELIGVDPNISSDSDRVECIKVYIEDIDINKFSNLKKTFLCSHTLEHIFDPNLFFKQLNSSSTCQDEFYFQFPSLDLMIRDSRFDQVHHQHIHYFSLNSISKLLANNGFKLINYKFDSDHYGTLMIYFKKSSIFENAPVISAIKANDIVISYESFLLSITSANSRLNFCRNDNLYCFGASLMLPILAYYMPNLYSSICILDNDINKHGLSYINFDKKIISDENFEYQNSDIVVTAVSTKLATRKIIKLLIDRKTENIILPLNTL